MKSRYIPFTQQPYLCVAACLQMVMYKNNIPLLPQEEIANALGLIVPKKDGGLFRSVETAEEPPKSGWGTRIQEQEYDPNKVLPPLSIPLKMKRYGIKEIRTEAKLTRLLEDIQGKNRDALLCFDYGRLWDIPNSGGHVCVFDFVKDGYVYMVDPERNVPKLRKAKIDRLIDAINFHGDDNATGVWVFTKIR